MVKTLKCSKLAPLMLWLAGYRHDWSNLTLHLHRIRPSSSVRTYFLTMDLTADCYCNSILIYNQSLIFYSIHPLTSTIPLYLKYRSPQEGKIAQALLGSAVQLPFVLEFACSRKINHTGMQTRKTWALESNNKPAVLLSRQLLVLRQLRMQKKHSSSGLALFSTKSYLKSALISV